MSKEASSTLFCIIEEIITSLLELERPDLLKVIQVDNWFGPRWCGFMGKVEGSAGARKFHGRLVVPPFHPNRIRSEQEFSRNSDGKLVWRSSYHPSEREESSTLHRLIRNPRYLGLVLGPNFEHKARKSKPASIYRT